MIKIHLLVFDKDKELSLPDGIECDLKERIQNTKSQPSRREKTAAYSLLWLVCKDKDYKMPTIIYNEHGKPAFLEKTTSTEDVKREFFSFNISHSEEIIAIAEASKQYDIGIDVQAEAKEEMLLHASKRFSEKEALNGCTGYDEDIEFVYYIIKEEKIEHITLSNAKKIINIYECRDSESMLVKWTLLEAVLKSLGGGFSYYSKLKDIKKSLKTKSFDIVYKNKKYALSIAIS